MRTENSNSALRQKVDIFVTQSQSSVSFLPKRPHASCTGGEERESPFYQRTEALCHTTQLSDSRKESAMNPKRDLDEQKQTITNRKKQNMQVVQTETGNLVKERA